MSNKISKRMLSVIIAMFIALMVAYPASAATPDQEMLQDKGLTLHTAESDQRQGRSEGIAPFWNYVDFIVQGCDFSGGTVDVMVVAYSSSHKISGTSTLQKLNGTSWGKVSSWSISGTGTASISKTASFSSGKYRIKTDIVVNGESITVYSAIQEY